MNRSIIRRGWCAFMAAALVLAVLPSLAGAQSLEALFTPETGRAWFVSNDGSNGNEGTKDAPLKNLDRAIKNAADGDTILVAGGTYMGTFNIGFFEADKPLKLYGGFAPDFSTRDPVAHPTKLQPDNASAAKSRNPLLSFTKNAKGCVVDGFVFDAGMRNSYHAAEGKPEGVATGKLLLPPAKNGSDAPTVEKPLLYFGASAGVEDMTIANNLFINGANYAIQGGIRGGTMKIHNNVFIANRMAAIEVYGTGSDPVVEVHNNTILFTWSRLDDFQDMGYGVRIMTKAKYDIQNNIIGGNIKGGIDHTRFNSDDNITLDNNVFFVNKTADMYYSPASNTSLDLSAGDFVDLPVASAKGNKNMIPETLPVDQAYLEGYLSARYSEQTDLDRNSPANQWRSALGMNLVGTIETQVSMFGNRYPVDEALKVFGAVEGVGAQKP